MPPSPSAQRGKAIREALLVARVGLIATALNGLSNDEGTPTALQSWCDEGYLCTHDECIKGRRAIEAIDAALALSETQPTPPITADALQAFLAPGVTTWTMTSADLPALARWMAGRRA